MSGNGFHDTVEQMMNSQDGNAIATMFMQTGKNSLMGRMASPSGGAAATTVVQKKNPANTMMSNTMGSTMAGTQ